MQINLPLLRQYNKNFEKTPKWVEDYSDEYDETGSKHSKEVNVCTRRTCKHEH